MYKKVFGGIVLFKLALVVTKEAELPLCPTNILYFPQNLPMHCRMPTSADFPGISGALPNGPSVNQNSPSDKQPPLPMPIQFPPGVGVPGPMLISGPMPMPGQMGMPGPVAVPGPIGPSGPISFAGPMPMPQGPSHKLPVVVMPFYSPDTSFKKAGRPNHPQHIFRPGKRKIRHKRRRPFHYSRDTSSSGDMESSSETQSSSSSEYQGWWKGKKNYRRSNQPIRMKKKRHYQRRQVLTPVLQYVTKDGYVIFEKKITKNEAKDWLNVKKDEKGISTRISPEARDMESNEPMEDHTAEKETITEDNVEAITKRNAHHRNKVKVVSAKIAKKKHGEHPH